MDVKIVKGVSFDAIRMFMAFAVIPAQSEETIGVGRAICENNGKVEWTKDALTQDQTKLIPTLSAHVEISFFMAALGSKTETRWIIDG